eukprot:1194536-Prorocentrum_minimum.AAC.9
MSKGRWVSAIVERVGMHQRSVCTRVRTERQERMAQGESSGRKWGIGHRVSKGKGLWGVVSTLALLAQEDP